MKIIWNVVLLIVMPMLYWRIAHDIYISEKDVVSAILLIGVILFTAITDVLTYVERILQCVIDAAKRSKYEGIVS